MEGEHKMSTGKKNNPGTKALIALAVVLVILVIAAAGAYLMYRKARTDRDNFQINAQTDAVNATNKQLEQWQAQQAEVDAYNERMGVVVTPAPVMNGWSVVDMTGYDMQNPTMLSMDRQSLLLGGGVLVNYWHPVPADMPEEQLVSVQTALEKRWQVSSASVRLFPAAATALDAMLNAAKNEGLENYIIEEGYRENDKQLEIWNKEASLSKYSNYSGTGLVERVNKVVAKPGTSEYQSGFAICIQRYKSGESDFNRSFAGTEHSEWLIGNSWKYGYVFRYPIDGYPASDTVDKSYITGRNNKLSIYRYVGLANAAVMNTNDWCMEEYYEYLASRPHLMIYENGKLRYEVVRVKYDGSAMVNVPVNAACNAYEITLDNLGGIIVAMTFN